MDHRAQVRVVEIEDVGAQRVQGRGIQDVGPLGAPEDGSLRGTGEFRKNAPNSSGVLPPGSAPSAAMRSRISGVRRILASSVCSLDTISAGVPLGTRMPVQPITS